MSPAALAERLDQRFELLDGAQTSMIARHRTLQRSRRRGPRPARPRRTAAVRPALRFAGSFDLDAAEAVCGGERPQRRRRVSMLLANLVDKSMVQLVDEDRPRYRVLETLREFGREHLDAEDERDDRARPPRALVPRRGRAVRRRAGRSRRGRPRSRRSTATSTTCGPHTSGRSSTTTRTSALRLVAALREYAFRCMRAEVTGWADAAIAAPRSRRSTSATRSSSPSPRTDGSSRGDLEGAIELGDQAIAAAERLGIDCSGLAERTLGNAWFYRNDAVRGTRVDGPHDRVGAHGSPARLTHALYMRSVAVHERRRQREGRAVRRRGARRGDRERVADGARRRRCTPSGSRSSRPIRPRRRRTCAALGRPRAATPATAGSRRSRSPRCCGSRPGRANHARRSRGYADVSTSGTGAATGPTSGSRSATCSASSSSCAAHLGAATLHGALTAAGAAYALPFEAADAEASPRSSTSSATASARHRSPPRSAAAPRSTTPRSSTSSTSRSGPSPRRPDEQPRRPREHRAGQAGLGLSAPSRTVMAAPPVSVCSPPARDCHPGRGNDEVGYLAAPATNVDTMYVAWRSRLWWARSASW